MQTGFLSAGPDKICQERSHLRLVLEVLVKIQADIIVQRETQKAIIIGEGGKMIKQLGTLARQDMEEFIGQKVFLQLFVKVKDKWRDNELKLREYGYNN